MPGDGEDEGAAGSAPPPPPPPPPPPVEDPSSKVSPIVLKLRSPPPGYFFQPQRPLRHRGPAPTGPYFFYGTLSDPGVLRDVLGLDTEPQLRPATMVGYECRLWGQYPTLLDAPEKIVLGAVSHVETSEQGERLAEYETSSYRADPCLIEYTDGNEPVIDKGHVFKFVGNVRDLSDGTFNLETWLKRMKR